MGTLLSKHLEIPWVYLGHYKQLPIDNYRRLPTHLIDGELLIQEMGEYLANFSSAKSAKNVTLSWHIQLAQGDNEY